MSAFFKLVLDGEEHEIEITRAGELVILGYDWEQDDMVRFMTGQRSKARKLVEKWHDDPTRVICYRLGLNLRMLRRLAADWAEHALPVFEDVCPGDDDPRKAIGVARKSADGKIPAKQCKQVVETAAKAARVAAERARWTKAAPCPEARAAAQAAARAADAARAGATVPGAAWAATEAARLAAEAADAADVEQDWQVRTFVRAMEYVRADKRWPGIKESP